MNNSLYMLQQKKIGKSKYNAKRTVVDGINFPSRLEASYFCALKLWQQQGSVKYFLRQVPLWLPGNVRYVVDFVVFHADGTVHYVECKGFMNAMAKLKIRQAEALYPINIEIITKNTYAFSER